MHRILLSFSLLVVFLTSVAPGQSEKNLLKNPSFAEKETHWKAQTDSGTAETVVAAEGRTDVRFMGMEQDGREIG